MNAVLAGRSTIVVGASSGIGLAVARRFHAAGAIVHALARRKTSSMGDDRFLTHAVDATDRAALDAAVATIVRERPIDVLVYCAGHNVPRRRLAELAAEDWDGIVRVNLDGAYYALRAVLPSLRQTQGTAIFISSASAAWPNLSGAAYQASKVGLLGLARAGAYDEHQNGVRFSVILPGVVDTPHLDRRPNPPGSDLRAKMLQPEDVAGACLFLATLPARAYVPELHLLPTLLQAPGKTDESSLRS
jgi:NAD(P)-dependent dehydrogenase (short-subunit alcohol dehydrogenase family)